jgi:hypothetical protein
MIMRDPCLPASPSRSYPPSRARQLLGWGLRFASGIAAGIAGVLILRLLFRIAIANPANPISTVLGTVSRPVLFPWSLLWPPAELPGPRIESATAAALITYVFIGLALGLGGEILMRQYSKRSQKE